MRPFRPHVAVAVDGGGIKGVIVARALAMLEDYLGQPVHAIFRLAAGTSTGAILSGGVACGISGQAMYGLYVELGKTVFRRTLRSTLWPLTRYRYSLGPLEQALRQVLGDRTLGTLWEAEPPTDVVITAFDLVTMRTRFVKPWKEEYKEVPLVNAVLASCAVPTYFPAMDGRYVDGGVGSYSNPCYLAAYEAYFCLGWDPAETTLISLGTGRGPHTMKAGDADRLWAWQWIPPMLGAFLQSADDQQVQVAATFFPTLDFRRFQVELREPLDMDDPRPMAKLTAYGEELGRKLLNDETDSVPDIRLARAPRRL